jgi:hypothetical protein
VRHVERLEHDAPIEQVARIVYRANPAGGEERSAVRFANLQGVDRDVPLTRPTYRRPGIIDESTGIAARMMSARPRSVCVRTVIPPTTSTSSVSSTTAEASTMVRRREAI